MGEMIQFDEHIFQMGWFNHQLAKIQQRLELQTEKTPTEPERNIPQEPQPTCLWFGKPLIFVGIPGVCCFRGLEYT